MDNQSQLQSQLVQIYKTLHKMPEIGLQQHKTTAYIRQYISKIEGVQQVQPKIQTQLKTGLIVVIRSQPVSTTTTETATNGYLFRCEIDALCFKQQSGLDYRSQNGMHHACGHDAHTAMMLVALKMIAKNRNKLKRNIYCCFQPGEQGHGGAYKMLQKYRHVIAKIEHSFALHIGNYRVAPMLVIPSQYATANSNAFTIQVIGHSAHCMMPYAAIDANYIGCQIVNQIYNCRTRLTQPNTGMAIAVTKIQGGTDNVARISQKLFIKGTIRSYQQKYHQKVLKYIQNFATSLCEVNGASCKFQVNKSFYRAVKNQKSAIDIVVKSAANIFQKVQFRGPSFAGEDFCEFSQKVPSCYFNLAVGLPDTIDSLTGESKVPVHNSKFKLDQNSLWKGSLLWAKIAQN